MGRIKHLGQHIATYASLVLIAAVPLIPSTSYANVGVQKWVQSYLPSTDSSAGGAPIKIVKDGDGNIYVGDSFYNTTSSFYTTTLVKYDPTGTKLWAATTPGSFSGGTAVQGLAYNDGNIYLTTDGSNVGSIDTSYTTLKYNDDGSLLWSQAYSGVVGRAYFGVTDSYMSVTADGSVYITGTDRNSDVTVKYSTSGNRIWVKHYSAGFGTLSDANIGITTDTSGNAYMFGFIGTGTASQDYQVVKYDTNGVQQWVKSYDSGGIDTPQNFHLDTSGNIYITGYTQAYSGDGYPQAMVTVKFNPNGDMAWVDTYKESGDNIAGGEIRTDVSGNVYMAATNGIPGHFTEILLKLDVNGNQQWVEHNDDGNQASVADLALASDGSVYLAGSGFKDYRNYYLLSKYDNNGNLQWSTTYDNGFGAVARNIALQGSSIYSTGYSCDSAACQLTTVKFLDDTPPTITANASPAANSNGWNNTDVTVSFICNDIDADLSSCPSPIYLSDEGGRRVGGTAIDDAGNQASTSKAVRIDKTAPNISYTLSPAPNAAGWNNSNVTVTFTCADALSGVQACSSPNIVNTEGMNQASTGNAKDLADSTSSVTATVKLDKTAPTISSATMSNTFFLFGGATTVSANTSDTLSGANGGEYYIDTDPGRGNGVALTYSGGKISGTATIPSSLSFGQHKLYMRSKDTAGNWSTTVSVTFTFI